METEKVILAEIYKKDGKIEIDFPNNKDVTSFEFYGFLKCYVDGLGQDLIDSFEKFGDEE